MARQQDDLPGAIATVTAIADGRMTAEDALRQRLERIEAREAEVQAWVAVDHDGALAAARMIDAGHGGALAGLPLGVKDIFAVRGLPWRCGSPIWADRVAEADAGVVALARAGGAVILGKTETTEFAGYTPTRTRNPHDLSRTPGGSSSGSAAAVACGMVPLAFGTQTSGSIIRPASYCGVVGFKPSFDLLEPGGVAPLARSLDTVGVFARSVPDAAFAVSILSGIDLEGDTGAPRRLPVYRSAAWSQAEPEMAAAWEAFEAALDDRFADQVFPAGIETQLTAGFDLHARIMATEAAQALAFEHLSAPEQLSDALRRQLEDGRAVSPDQRTEDRRALLLLRRQFDTHVPRDAVWLTPSATGPAPAFEDGTGAPAFNRLWSLLGLPCCSVPLLATEDGLPIGVQVVGALGNDRGVLSVAHRLMTEFGTV